MTPAASSPPDQPKGHTPDRDPSGTTGFVAGMKAGAGLGAATFVLWLTFGALARAAGWG
jgi:hypothetical protein